jgi:hypothetical protein
MRTHDNEMITHNIHMIMIMIMMMIVVNDNTLINIDIDNDNGVDDAALIIDDVEGHHLSSLLLIFTLFR